MTDTIETTDHPADAQASISGTVPDENLLPENEEQVDEGGVSNATQSDGDQVDDETFPREYVEKLRAENAENRVKAKRADDLARRLHEALTAATGRLQDASDLPFDEAHLEDPEALTTAIDSLLEAKPHLASRRVSGDIGQGATGNPETRVNLAGLLRSRA